MKKFETYILGTILYYIVLYCTILCCIELYSNLAVGCSLCSCSLPVEVRPAQDREEPGGGERPGQAYHHQRSLLGPLPQVPQGGGDGPVPLVQK